MLAYTMDVEERSRWLRCTPGPLHLAQGFHASEAGEFFAHERFMTERDGKDSYLLFYTVSGAGEVMQGNSVLRLDRGEALLMDCRTPQRYRTHPDVGHWHHLWAHVDGTSVQTMAQAMGLPDLHKVPLHEPGVTQTFERLMAVIEKENAASVAGAGLCVHELLVMAAEAEAKPSNAMEAASRKVIRIAEDFMAEHYAEQISVGDIADYAAISKTYLIRLFKRHMQSTPYNYLLRYRITRAKELLAETDLPVGRIATDVGFANESIFSYRFSQIVGESPTSYRLGTPGLSPD